MGKIRTLHMHMQSNFLRLVIWHWHTHTLYKLLTATHVDVIKATLHTIILLNILAVIHVCMYMFYMYDIAITRSANMNPLPKSYVYDHYSQRGWD